MRALPAALALCLAAGVAHAQESGYLVRGGTLIDGTGSAARRADVRVAGDSVVEVAATLQPRAGERVIDASGRVVAPGFIDPHSHVDRSIAASPDAESQIRQGITTAIVGQDGGSELPVADLFATVERAKPTINFASFIGYGTVRGVVLGADYRRAATAAEIATMRALVRRGMLDGALGLSSGLEYEPDLFGPTSELVALAREVSRFGGAYASHVRDENRTIPAWKEAVEIGRRAGVPVLISHAKMAARPWWGQAGAALAALDSARRRGVRVMADWYPYTYWSTGVVAVIPGKNIEDRAEWHTALGWLGGAENLLVVGYPDSTLNRRTLSEIARLKGTDSITAVIDMIKSAGSFRVIGTSMDEPDLRTFVASPLVVISSDGDPRSGHPRAFGAFPRVLARYVRDEKLLSLPEAIAKMSGRTAAFLGIRDRGTIAVGKKADLVIFDAETIQDHATKENPRQPSTGVDYVMVNGLLVLDAGRMTGERPGKVIRRHRD
ncbi:MAG TPA: amidohydrolase family protein [Gemmatimonadaceae bacterium]|nr:amidohydrolase family protein [Gemmatimonadaceae bacterium]